MILSISLITGSTFFQVGLGFLILFVCFNFIFYFALKKINHFINKKGLIGLLSKQKQKKIANFLLEWSCLDVVNNLHSNNWATNVMTDFVVSLTLPMSRRERRAIIRRLPIPVRQMLKKKGLIHLLPTNIQQFFLPNVVFKYNINQFKTTPSISLN